MSYAFSIQGATSGNIAEVSEENQLQTNPPLTSIEAGFVSVDAEIDPGTYIGYRYVRSLKCSDEYRFQTGKMTPIFDYQFTNTAQDTDFWRYTFTSMTAIQLGGFLVFNSNATLTASTGVTMQTWRYFKVMSNAELYVEITINLTAYPLANQIAEFGLFIPTQTTAPADGVYFRVNNNGLFGVLNNSGTETMTGPLFTTLAIGESYQLAINIAQYKVEFWAGGVGGTLLAVINVPPGNTQPFASTALPLGLQQRNSGGLGAVLDTTPVMQLKVGSVLVSQDDLILGMPYSHIQGAYGLAYQGLPGGTQGNLASYSVNNATALTATVLNNTTANITGLGGLAETTVTFAINDDGIVFAYTNPAGGISQTPRTLVITSINIQSIVSTVMAATASSYMYSVAFGGTSVSLLTAQTASFVSATTKSFKIFPLGIETYAASAPVGTLGSSSPIVADFLQSPIVVNPGEVVEIISRCLVGPPASGAIITTCGIKHYWI
jgi:hypothetical protein